MRRLVEFSSSFIWIRRRRLRGKNKLRKIRGRFRRKRFRYMIRVNVVEITVSDEF